MIAAVAIVGALIGAWELYADFGGVNSLILPAPHQVASSFYDDRSLLWSNLTVTAREMILGLLFAFVSGLILAVALHEWRTARRAVYPLLIGSQTIPIPTLAPLLVFWWGFGIAPKLFIIALVCFFPIVVPTLDALDSIDADHAKLMRTLGASRWQQLRFVEAPAALPGAFTGARLAVAIAAIAAYLAESSGATNGLGVLVSQANSQLEVPRAYASILLLALCCIVLFGALSLAEQWLLPWTRRRPEHA